MEPEDCIFCAIVAGEAPAHVVYDDRETVAFMDINPATEGHVLVVPRRHSRDLFDIPPEDGEAVWRAAHRIAMAARDAFRPDGVNVVQATGRAAFQTVFHFHLHVIPRYEGDGLQPPWIPTPGDPERISAAAGRLKALL
jgi:histidine triad (HIT) family protein